MCCEKQPCISCGRPAYSFVTAGSALPWPFCKARLMAAGLIRRSFALTPAVMWKSGWFSKKGIWDRMRGERNFPRLYQKKARREQRQTAAFGPQTGFRPPPFHRRVLPAFILTSLPSAMPRVLVPHLFRRARVYSR